MDYYQTLGVARDADPQTIKRAYRKLAGQHHPDKGGDEAEFKKLQEAYEGLSDPQKRQMYDQFGTVDPQQQGGPQGFSFNFNTGSPFDDVMSQFGFSNRGPQQQRNPDAQVNLNISLLQSYTGGDFNINAGVINENISLPPGIREGAKLRIHGKGHQRFKQLPPGDLIVRIQTQMPPNMARDGDNVLHKINIDCITAMIGGEIEYEHFAGSRFKVKIPRGSCTGERLRLSQWGMPSPNNINSKGHLFLILDIKTPNITNPEHISMLNKIKDEVFK